MESDHFIRYVVAGQLKRSYLLPAEGDPILDAPGGNLLYAAAGLRVWDNGVGLVSRVGEDYPQHWLDQLAQAGFDRRGIRVLPESLDLRTFTAYPDIRTAQTDNPVGHFARLGLPFPKALLDYKDTPNAIDSRTRLLPTTVRAGDLPGDYLDATAAHLCPMDFISHRMLPPSLRQGHINTITLDPSAGYMNPTFWDDIPPLLTGITAFLTSEAKARSLFQGRTEDLWAMAESLASHGCEIVAIKRADRGQYLYDGSRSKKWIVPPYPANTIDPTGAGSSYCGGFLAGFRRTFEPLEAALYGSVSASFTVEGLSPYYPLDALPGLAEARLAALRDMVRPA